MCGSRWYYCRTTTTNNETECANEMWTHVWNREAAAAAVPRVFGLSRPEVGSVWRLWRQFRVVWSIRIIKLCVRGHKNPFFSAAVARYRVYRANTWRFIHASADTPCAWLYSVISRMDIKVTFGLLPGDSGRRAETETRFYWTRFYTQL